MLKDNNILWSIGQLAALDVSNISEGTIKIMGGSDTGEEIKYSADIFELASMARDRIQELELAIDDFVESEPTSESISDWVEDLSEILNKGR